MRDQGKRRLANREDRHEILSRRLCRGQSASRGDPRTRAGSLAEASGHPRSAARARVDSRPEWQEKIKGRPGIVYFADYWRRPAEKDSTGDHIDLWNGRRLTASGLEGTLVTFMRFGLGINSGILYSDLGSARTFLFWEVGWLGSAPRGLQPSSVQWQ